MRVHALMSKRFSKRDVVQCSLWLIIGFFSQTMEKRCEEEVKKKDMKIIMELDQKVMDQQVMLEKAGVPGFYVTNKSIDVRIQMYLLDFITRLGHMQPP